MQLIKKGAEANIYRENCEILKKRIEKKYRIAQLDEKLRKERTRAEAKLLERAALAINVPKVTGKDIFSIRMEFVEGKRLKDAINQKNYVPLCKKIGKMAAQLHNSSIIHGDLTTSNMLVNNSELYFIDFGLGFFSHSVEDAAVDLRLLQEAFHSTHPQIAEHAFDVVLEEYENSGGNKEVRKRLEKIMLRGRYILRAEKDSRQEI